MGWPCIACRNTNVKPSFALPTGERGKEKLKVWCRALEVKVPDNPAKFRICYKHFTPEQLYKDKAGHYRVLPEQIPNHGLYEELSPFITFARSLVDAELIASDGRSLPCNQSLLAAFSPYLRELLLSAGAGVGDFSPSIILPDVDGDALLKLGEFIYTGEVPTVLSTEERVKLETAYFTINGGEAFRIKSRLDFNMLSPHLRTPTDPFIKLLDQSPIGLMESMFTPVDVNAPAPIKHTGKPDQTPANETPKLTNGKDDELDELEMNWKMIFNPPVPISDRLEDSNGNIPSTMASNNNPQISNGTRMLDEVPVPRVTLFRREQVEIGYRSPTGPGSGMFNMGNTCYLNSTLQVFNTTNN